MRTILLVDDDELFCASIRAGLEQKAYRVLVANDGASALRTVERDAPDVVVLDLFMPGMEGMETLQRMQRLRPQMPVYVITGGGRNRLFEMLDVAEGFGAAGSLRKPFAASDLIRLIEKKD